MPRCHALVASLLFIAAASSFAEREEQKDRAGAPAARARRPEPIPNDNSLDAPPVVIPAPSLLAVRPPDGRVTARGEGFVALGSVSGGSAFVAYKPDGTVAETLFAPGHAVDRWWLSPDGKRLAWTSGGTLYTTVVGARTMDTLGTAPAGTLAFSSDGSRVAFVRDGKAVVRTFDGGAECVVAPAAGLVLGDATVLSADGKTLYATVGSVAGAPDGLAAADLSAGTPTLARIFEASRSRLRYLLLSPDGQRLAFVQAGEKGPEALRLFDPASGDVKTVARAATLESPAFSPSGGSILFAGKEANGKWQTWSVTTSEDVTKGTFIVQRLAHLEGSEIAAPVPATDGGAWVIVRKEGDPGPGVIGRVK